MKQKLWTLTFILGFFLSQTAGAACVYKSYDSYLGLMLSPPTHRGMAVVNGGVNKDWFACEKKSGGTIELIFFEAKTKAEVEKMKEPTFVLKGLENSPRFDQNFAMTEICKTAPKFIGFELRGTKGFAQLSKEGRSIKEITCK